MLSKKLYDYQNVAVDFVAGRPGSALFFEQGTGKTWVTAGVIEQLMSEDFRGLLVVPLANIETTWVKTLKSELPKLHIARTWQELKKAKGPTVLLVHYEAVPKLINKICRYKWTLVVYDESQKLKGRGTKQSRAAARFKSVEHRVILSGTPIEQAPQDLWAQFRFAVPEVLGDRWKSFANRWLKPTGYMGYKLKFKEHLLPQFIKLIEPHILRVKKDDVLDLPTLTHIREPVPLLGQQARVYKDLERHMVTEVDGEVIRADLAITQLVRLQQACGGFLKAADGRIIPVGQAKLRRLKVILAREKPPIVIFCKYREELKRIVDACAHLRVGCIRGAQGAAKRRQRTATIEAFQRGELDVLVCQIRAGGVGLDLYRANVAIFYSTTFSFIDYDQAVSRLHRHGQERSVRIYDLFAKDTVDEDIYTAVRSKLIVSNKVLKRRLYMAAKTAKVPAKTEKPAKAPKAEAKTEAAPAEKKEKAPEFKYGVPALAELLGIKPASVRVRLRNSEIPKAGKSYGWNTKDELKAVADQLKAKAKDTEETDEDEGDEDE